MAEAVPGRPPAAPQTAPRRGAEPGAASPSPQLRPNREIAKAVEILGDRWTLLIVRDMLTGTRRFNDLERGLPGISRALLAARLRYLQRIGILEKRVMGHERATEYHLTQAGEELQGVINALLAWGARWAFGPPTAEEIDPLLLLWWMRDRVSRDRLPARRVVVQFDFSGAETVTYWLILAPDDVSVCLTHPGYDIDVLVKADIATCFQVWLGRMSFARALRQRQIEVDGPAALARAFPSWFALSLAAPVVRASGRDAAMAASRGG